MFDIFQKNVPIPFDSRLLPCLIHGAAQTGTSLFTTCLLSRLYRQGRKLLVISRYAMVGEVFAQQVDVSIESVFYDAHRALADQRAIFLLKGAEKQFLRLAQTLPDVAERVLLVNNLEAFEPAVIHVALQHPASILSGDVEASPAREAIWQQPFASYLALGAGGGLPFALPEMERYEGYLYAHHNADHVRLRVPTERKSRGNL